MHVKDGVITRIESDGGEEPQHRACARGRAYRQRVYAPDRLKYPLKRVGERGEARYAWVAALPLAWLILITSTAAWQKIASADVRIGFFAAAGDLKTKLAEGLLPPEKASLAPRLIINLHLDAWLTLFLVCLLWLIVLDMLRVSGRHLSGKPVPPLSEAPHIPSRLVENWARDYEWES